MDDFNDAVFIAELARHLDVSNSVAEELALLSGYDAELAEQCSENSDGLRQCRYRIINERFNRLEKGMDLDGRTETP